MATIVTRTGKGSALTFAEGDANFTNLNDDKIEALSDDAAPALGGDLDVGANSIVTTVTDGDITLSPPGTGSVVVDSDTLIMGAGVDPEALITTAGAVSLSLDTNDGIDSGLITIAAGVDGDIEITPNGTGAVVLDGISYPQADGGADQVIKTNGAGVLSFVTVTSATGAELENVVEDTTPQLGGNLDVNGQSIVSVSSANIVIASDNNTIITVKNKANTGIQISEADIGEENDPLLVPVITNAGTGDTLLVFADAELNLGAGTGNVIIESGTGSVEIASDTIIDGELTVNGNDEDTPVDDTTPAAYLEVTVNDSVYYLPLFQ